MKSKGFIFVGVNKVASMLFINEDLYQDLNLENINEHNLEILYKIKLQKADLLEEI